MRQSIKILIAIGGLIGFQTLGLTQQATSYSNKEIKLFEKLSININELGTWSYLDNVSTPALSNDGKYCKYRIRNFPNHGNTTMVLQATNGNWKKEFLINDDGYFSANSKQFIFFHNKAIYFFQLGSDRQSVIDSVTSFKVSNDGLWLAFQKNEKLVIQNLSTNYTKLFDSVTNYTFSGLNKKLLLVSSSNKTTSIRLISLVDNKASNIYTSKNIEIESFAFDNEDKQLSFVAKDEGGEKTIWYYSLGMDKAVLWVDNNASGIENDLEIRGGVRFSRNGMWLLFELEAEKERMPKAIPESANLNVWTYKDLVLQPEQMGKLSRNASLIYTAAIKVSRSKVVRLEYEDEKLMTDARLVTGSYVVIKDKISTGLEDWWTLDPTPSFYVVSLESGVRRFLKQEKRNTLSEFTFSPNGRFLVYWNTSKDSCHWFSYELATHSKKNLTKNLTVPFSNEEYSNSSTKPAAASVAGWANSGKSVVISDNYDLWEVDVSNPLKFKNLTNGYGRKNHISFWPAIQSEFEDLLTNKSLLLTAFATQTKSNGFYTLNSANKENPEILIMGSNTYQIVPNPQAHSSFYFDLGMAPVKAKDANVWLLKKQSATEAPNLLTTEDFKAYLNISNLKPQSSINWLTSELITYRQLDGTLSQAVLYKPSNFDSTKKYPIILNYYQKLSSRLNQFPYPDFTKDDLNVPWFVSNGYIVCTPDVYHQPNVLNNMVTGERTLNSVVALTKFLKTKSFIDGERIGIQGHSFGGMQTNYLASHTRNLFAAAAEFAGSSDPVSDYLVLTPTFLPIEHYNRQSQSERILSATKSNLWERQDLFLRNSSVLSADKVTCPLLITHNPKDNNVNFRQGVEMYMAMRRLAKKCWLLEYPESGHGVEGKDAKDYTIRLTQFFDHYLKSAPAPVWMTQGIPARLKQVITGYDFDPSGNCGKDCKVCRYWNELYKKDSAATMIEIREKAKEKHWVIGNQ